MTASEYIIRMDPNNVATLIDILKSHEARSKALAGLTLITDAEKTVFIGEAAVCQYAYLQLEGVYYENPTGAPDWSAAEVSGKLPSEALAAIVDDGGTPGATLPDGTTVDVNGAQTDVQPTPAPRVAAQPFPARRPSQCASCGRMHDQGEDCPL